jgi:hypothetical protein
MKTMNIKHTATSRALLKAALKTAPLTSVILGILPLFPGLPEQCNATWF